jgi:hypothetical protein
VRYLPPLKGGVRKEQVGKKSGNNLEESKQLIQGGSQ